MRKDLLPHLMNYIEPSQTDHEVEQDKFQSPPIGGNKMHINDSWKSKHDPTELSPDCSTALNESTKPFALNRFENNASIYDFNYSSECIVIISPRAQWRNLTRR